MLNGLDLETDGKRLYDLRALLPDVPGLEEDVLCVIRNGEGPRILICGGIHGDEYEPQVLLRQLISELDVADVRGRLILIPSINFPASQRGARLSPLDGENMNRTFPGSADGSATLRLSAFMNAEIFPQADLLIDLHAGGNDFHVVPMIFGFTTPSCKFDNDALERVMESWGYPYIQYVDGIDSTSAGAAPLAGTASVEIEGGGGGALSTAELATMRDGLLRGLRALGVLTGESPVATAAPLRVETRALNNIAAPATGLLEHRVALHDRVEAGDLLAVLHPSAGAGHEPVEIRTSRPGVVLRQRAKAFVRKGEMVGTTGTPVA